MDFKKFPSDTRAMPSTFAFSKVQAFQLYWHRETESATLTMNKYHFLNPCISFRCFGAFYMRDTGHFAGWGRICWPGEHFSSPQHPPLVPAQQSMVAKWQMSQPADFWRCRSETKLQMHSHNIFQLQRGIWKLGINSTPYPIFTMLLLF